MERQDAIAMLKSDHREEDKLFERFEQSGRKDSKQKIAMQICRDLTVHTQLEEEIFYPACEGKVDDDLLKESYVEHDSAKVLIAEIEAGEPDNDEFYKAKVKVLSEQIQHHVKEEEKRLEGVFAQARRSGLDLDALGEKMASAKKDLLKRYEHQIDAPEVSTFERVSI